MLLSYNLLKKYVNLPENVTPQDVAYKLTMSTVEVESVLDKSQELENVLVGKVKKLEKHPNADKLNLASVDIGGSQKHRKHRNTENTLVKVVCGGTNLRKGMLVAFAKVGTMIRWHGEGDLVKLAKAKIRGVESRGMICSANEIGLFEMFPHEEFEILDLSDLNKDKSRGKLGISASLRVGQPLAEALELDEIVFDIDNQSLTNRPDLWSHYGVARELAAIYDVSLNELELSTENTENTKTQKTPELKIIIQDKKLCPRYFGVVIENLKIQESPQWMKNALASVGYKAINNVVDITNYVMMEVGEPLHAFDVAALRTNQHKKERESTQIIVRRARKGERLVTLDEENRKLDESCLVIADSTKPVALAGVMGGLKSGISGKTTTMILEAANFDALTVRRTAQKLGLRTEGSMRWEKSLDPNLAETGMRRTLQLIQELIPDARVKEVVKVDYFDKKLNTIKVEHDFLEKRIGKKLTVEEVSGILSRLGFGVKENSGVYNIQVPSWRATGDVSIPEDFVEEVARIYGYDNLDEKVELVEMNVPKHQKEYNLEDRLKNYLSVGCGMHEVFNYPWADIDLEINSGSPFHSEIEIANPPAEDSKYLQQSLVPNLIKNVKDNLRYFNQFKLFELARVYQPGKVKYDGNDLLPQQPKMLAGVVVGDKESDAFGEVKGVIEGLLKDLRFKIPASPAGRYDLRISDLQFDFINSDQYLEIVIGKEKIGWLGEYKDKIKNKNVALFEIDFAKLVANTKDDTKYKALPQFPAIERDIAIEVDWKVKWEDVHKFILTPIYRGKDPIVKEVIFLSEYALENKKSLAFRVVYQADRTLKDEEVEKVEKKIIKTLESRFKAQLRK